jgi:hypothetical protein
LAQVEH